MSDHLNRALAAAWEAIAANHAAVPRGVEVRAVPPIHGDGVWASYGTDSMVYVYTPCFSQGAAAVFEALLHEAAHAVHHRRCQAAGVRWDPRDHGILFQLAAVRLGLKVDRDGRTSLPHETAERYRDEIMQIRQGILLWQGVQA